MQVFEESGKTGVPGGKPLRAEKRINKLIPGQIGGTEASALTTTPPLLSMSLKVEAMFFTFTSPWVIELKTIYGAQCKYLPQQVRPKFN